MCESCSTHICKYSPTSQIPFDISTWDTLYINDNWKKIYLLHDSILFSLIKKQTMFINNDLFLLNFRTTLSRHVWQLDFITLQKIIDARLHFHACPRQFSLRFFFNFFTRFSKISENLCTILYQGMNYKNGLAFFHCV